MVTRHSQSRKTRQRLAQRSYRSRKETALTSARSRASELEASLAKAMHSFNQFQSFVASRNGEALPSDVLLQLTKTASELAAIGQLSRPASDDQAKSPPITNGQSVEKHWHVSDPNHSPISLKWFDMPDNVASSMAHRFLLACVDRALKLFSLDNPAREWPALGLLNPLIVLERHKPGSLHKLTTIHMGGIIRGQWVDALYEPHVRDSLPRMFRTVEGQANIVMPRVSPPNLQSLKFGRTRTLLRTDVQGLQGEWLEALDVEEYLSERGIYIRSGSPSNRIVLGLPSTDHDVVEDIGPAVSGRVTEIETSAVPETTLRANRPDVIGSELHERWKEYATTELGLPLPDSTIFGMSQGSFTQIPTGTWSYTPSPSQYSDLLGMQASAAGSGLASPLPSVTVDIDKLVSMLAIEAVCLGPGPGVRRAAVDLAIRESLTIDSFPARHISTTG